MENYAKLHESLESLKGSSFEWQGKVYAVTGIKTLYARWVILTNLRTFSWDAAQFADWLEDIKITDKPPSERKIMAVPGKQKTFVREPVPAVLAECERTLGQALDRVGVEPSAVRQAVREKKKVRTITLNNKIMGANDAIMNYAGNEVATSVNGSAKKISESLLKEIDILDQNPTADDLARIMTKCKVADTLVGVASLQVKVEQLKQGM